MRHTTLVSVTDLAAHLDDAGWIVCDCRHDLADTEAAAVLGGGWNAWLNASHSIADQIPGVEAARFTARARTGLALDANSVAARLGKRGPLLLDARAPDRYRGENETLDPVGGHIPGAANRFFKLNLGTDGRFKPATILRKEFAELLGNNASEQVTHYCGSDRHRM